MTVALNTQHDSEECLTLIRQLLEAFDDASIQYVHWKSNTNIARALVGIDDLDLLVNPQDREQTEAIFRSFRIIRALSPKDQWQRDIFHFLGADLAAGTLVHVHVHYALPVGFDYDKNYVLPIVDAYIGARWKHGPIFLPQVEMEYVVLVIRLIIKNALAPLLLQLPNRQWQKIRTARAHGVVTGGGYAEFLDLAARSDRDKVAALLDGPLAFIGREEFDVYEKTLQSNNSLVAFFRAGSMLKRRLARYGTNSEIMSFAKAFVRLMTERLSKIRAKLTARPRQRKRSSLGGRIIAFVGGDGAGKSTNVAALSKTLAQQLTVRTVHIGRPSHSVLGAASRALAIAARSVGMREHADAFNYLTTALNRRSAFRRACHWRELGEIVVVDRLPLPGITRMDCPRIHQLSNGRLGRLAALEQRLHSEIIGVDALIVLKLDPKIALDRRPEDDAKELLMRSGEIWTDAWRAPYANVIDTGIKSQEPVRREVLDIAWACISRPFARVEMVGLSGSGKSTLVNSLRDRVPNMRSSLPFWSHPWASFCGAFLGASTALRAYQKTRNAQVAKNCLQLFAAAALVRKFERGGAPATNLFLDQGPVFQFALALKEDVLTHVGRIKAGEACGLLKAVFRLDVPVDDLYKRVVARHQQAGRAQSLDATTFRQFCEDYRSSLDAVSCGSVVVVSIDGARPIHEITAEVLERVAA